MKSYVNGQCIELTAEEIADMQTEHARVQAQERHRPLTEQEVMTMLLCQQVNTIEVDDQTAVRMTAFYPAWQSGQAYTAGHKVQRGGKLCRCIQAHTAQSGWEPENAASLWEYINEQYAGDLYDPIPYGGSMALENGKYYTQGGVVYLCVQDTVNPVYNPLSELVGLYVEAAA